MTETDRATDVRPDRRGAGRPRWGRLAGMVGIGALVAGSGVAGLALAAPAVAAAGVPNVVFVPTPDAAQGVLKDGCSAANTLFLKPGEKVVFQTQNQLTGLVGQNNVPGLAQNTQFGHGVAEYAYTASQQGTFQLHFQTGVLTSVGILNPVLKLLNLSQDKTVSVTVSANATNCSVQAQVKAPGGVSVSVGAGPGGVSVGANIPGVTGGSGGSGSGGSGGGGGSTSAATAPGSTAPTSSAPTTTALAVPDYLANLGSGSGGSGGTVGGAYDKTLDQVIAANNGSQGSQGSSGGAGAVRAGNNGGDSAALNQRLDAVGVAPGGWTLTGSGLPVTLTALAAAVLAVVAGAWFVLRRRAAGH